MKQSDSIRAAACAPTEKETAPQASEAEKDLLETTQNPNAAPHDQTNGAGTKKPVWMKEQVENRRIRFLKTLFGDQYRSVYVTAFPEDPAGNYPNHIRGRMWRGGTFEAKHRELKPDCNQYVVVSTFKPSLDPKDNKKPRRQIALFERCYAIMVDDIGTKVREESIKLGLTAKVETSPGNFQGWYALQPDDPDAATVRLVDHVVDEMIRRGLAKSDPGMKGVTRYGRLPAGVNNKAKLGKAFKVKLTELNPDLRYTLARVAEAYGIDLQAAKVPGSLNKTPVALPDADRETFKGQLLEALAKAGCHPREHPSKAGGFDVTCPWVETHTDRADSGSMVFLPGYVDMATGEEYVKGGFKCHHGHCEGRTLRDVVGWLNKEHGAGLTMPGDVGLLFEPVAVKALAQDDDDPVDLFHPPLPRPLDLEAALPPILRDFALAHAEARGHDPTAYAYAILPVMATALNRDTQVALRGDCDWREFLVIWSGLVGTTGTGKSPVMSTAVKALDSLQGAAWKEYQHQKLIAELKKENGEAAADGEDKPRLYLYVINDTTIEALQDAIAGNPHGVLHHKDEGAGWLNGMGKYANAAGAAAERAAYLTAWNGGQYTITRIKRGQVPIERWGLNQLFGITPAQIKEGYAEAASDGMLARMFVYEMHHEQSLPRRESVDPSGAAQVLQERVIRLAALPAVTLRLSPVASRLFEERAADYRQLALALGPTEPGLAAVYAKAAPHLGRLAALFQLADGVPADGHVSERAMRWSLRFMAHALGEAERLHKHVFGHDTPYDIARRCAAKILTYGKARIEKNELLKVNAFKTAQDSERAAALRYLLAYKWLLDADTKRVRSGPHFHDATAWLVNPRVHEKFADVARREREEAARLIALMARVKAP